MQTTTEDVAASIAIAERQEAVELARLGGLIPVQHPNDVPIDFVKLSQNPLYQTNEQKLLGANLSILAVLERIEMLMLQFTELYISNLPIQDRPKQTAATPTAPVSTSVTAQPSRKMFVGKPRR